MFRGGLLISFAIFVGAVLSAANQWALARFFPKADFGYFATAWAVAQIALQMIMFGTNHFLLNRGDKGGFRLWLPYVIRVSSQNSIIIACSILVAYQFFTNVDQPLVFTYLVFWAAFSIPTSLLFVALQFERDIWKVAFWPLLQIGLRSIVIVAAIIFGFSITQVAFGYLLSAVILGVISFTYRDYLIRAVIDSPKTLFATRIELVYRHSRSYMGFEVLEKLDLKLAVPACLLILGPVAGASFAVAIGILLAALILPQGLMQRYFLPQIHVWARSNDHELKKFMIHAGAIAFIASTFVSLILYNYQEHLIVLLFGNKYDETSELINVLLFIVPILIVSNLLSNRFLALEQIGKLVRFQAVYLVLFLMLLVVTTNKYGLLGACWSILISRTFYLVCLMIIGNLNKRAEAVN